MTHETEKNGNGVIRIKTAYASFILAVIVNVIAATVYITVIRSEVTYTKQIVAKHDGRLDKLEELLIKNREDVIRQTIFGDEVKNLKNMIITCNLEVRELKKLIYDKLK